MQIFVEDIQEKILILEVESTDTIGDVKSMIQQQWGVPRNFQKILNKRRLEDDKTLSDYNVQNHSTFYLETSFLDAMLNPGPGTSNNIKATGEDNDGTGSEQQSPDDGRTQAINNIEKESTVEDKEEISLDQEHLEDGSTLVDYKIQKKSTIPMQISMRVVPSKKNTLELPSRDKIRNLKITTEKKSTLEKKGGIPLRQQCLDDRIPNSRLKTLEEIDDCCKEFGVPSVSWTLEWADNASERFCVGLVLSALVYSILLLIYATR